VAEVGRIQIVHIVIQLKETLCMLSRTTYTKYKWNDQETKQDFMPLASTAERNVSAVSPGTTEQISFDIYISTQYAPIANHHPGSP